MLILAVFMGPARPDAQAHAQGDFVPSH